MNKLFYGSIHQHTTFQELRHLTNVLLAKETFKIFLENRGVRTPCGAFLVDLFESAQFQKILNILSLYPLSDLPYKVGYNLTSSASCPSCISASEANLSNSLLSLYYDCQFNFLLTSLSFLLTSLSLHGLYMSQVSKI